MNSKAIRKQLFAAVAMVLVAAVALGSSTYAWFVASSEVTATGMKVQAQSEAGLAIRYGSNDWGTTATTDQAMKQLKPTSTKDGNTWYYAKAEYTNQAAALAGTRTTLTESQLTTDHCLISQFQIKSTSTTAKVSGLYVKGVTVTGFENTNKPMNTALRVGVQFKTAQNTGLTDASDKFVIFAPVKVGDKTAANSPSTEYWVNGETGDNNKVVPLYNIGTATNANLLAESIAIPTDTNSESPVYVNIYVWYEGEDHNLHSENYVAETLNVSVNFSSISTTSSSSTPVIPKVELKDATVTSTTTTVNSQTYTQISVKTTDGKDLYVQGSTISSGATVYTIDGNTVTEYTNVQWST